MDNPGHKDYRRGQGGGRGFSFSTQLIRAIRGFRV